MDDKAAAIAKHPYFDTAARERIRGALLAYMKENRIGVPTLQRVIAEANEIVIDRVPLKTLQRFLADTHRSNDGIVRFYANFLRTLPESEPLDLFGSQLAAFHAVPVQDGDGTSSSASSLEHYAGVFEGTALARPQGLAIHGTQQTAVISALELTQRSVSPYLRAAERISNWHHQEASDGEVRRAYEGVAVLTGTGLLIALRNTLTGAPRTYWLTDHPAGLAGQGAEPVSSLDCEPPPLFDRVRWENRIFRRAQEAAHDQPHG